MPQAQDDLETKIAEMLAKGMSEEEVLQAFQPAAPPADPTSGFKGAQRIGPADSPSTLQNLLRFATGIVDPLQMTPEEERGTLPLPFTDKRLEPSTAIMNAAAMVPGMAYASRAVPAAVQRLMSMTPGAKAKAANVWANKQFPARLTNPQRLLPQRATPPPPAAPSTPSFDDILPNKVPPSLLMTGEEAGTAGAMMNIPKFGMRPPPPGPRLVPGQPRESVEDVIARVLQELYRQ